MNTIFLRSLKIVILQDIDEFIEILEDCMDLNHYDNSLSRQIDLAIDYKESIMHEWMNGPGGHNVFVQGRGCQACMNTGYQGRTGIYEILIINDEIKNIILNNKSAHEIERAAIRSGNFNTLKENAIEKALQGVTTIEEVASVVMP